MTVADFFLRFAWIEQGGQSSGTNCLHSLFLFPGQWRFFFVRRVFFLVSDRPSSLSIRRLMHITVRLVRAGFRTVPNFTLKIPRSFFQWTSKNALIGLVPHSEPVCPILGIFHAEANTEEEEFPYRPNSLCQSVLLSSTRPNVRIRLLFTVVFEASTAVRSILFPVLAEISRSIGFGKVAVPASAFPPFSISMVGGQY